MEIKCCPLTARAELWTESPTERARPSKDKMNIITFNQDVKIIMRMEFLDPSLGNAQSVHILNRGNQVHCGSCRKDSNSTNEDRK